MTQFGLQAKSTTEWIISRRIFRNKKIPGREIRPFEGDLIMIGPYQATAENPIWTNTLFEITYVKRDMPFWPLGKYYLWQVDAEMYQHNYEKFDTGNPHLDRANHELSNEAELELSINKALKDTMNTLIDFDEKNPFGNL